MNVSFEYSKTLAGEGAILLLLSVVPYAGWILGIIGVVLLLKAMKELSGYYQDESIYQQALSGVKFYVVAILAVAVAGVAFAIGFGTTIANPALTAGFWIGVAALIAGLVVAFIFYILATRHLRDMFNTLAAKSGEASFTTAGTLMWIGAWLTIIAVGIALIFVAWIFATIGFFAMKPRQLQQYTYAQQPTDSTPPQPTQTTESSKSNFSTQALTGAGN